MTKSTTQSTNPSTAQSTPQPTTHSITQSTTQSMPDDADKPALNSYTFVIPEAEEWWLNWYNLIIDFPDYKRLETGQSFTFSRSCNPNLEFNYRSWKYSCETVETSPQFCSNPVRVLVGWASYNTYGISFGNLAPMPTVRLWSRRCCKPQRSLRCWTSWLEEGFWRRTSHKWHIHK